MFDADGTKLATIAETQLDEWETSMQIVFEDFQKVVIDALENSWRAANLYVVGGRDEIFIEVGASSPKAGIGHKKCWQNCLWLQPFQSIA